MIDESRERAAAERGRHAKALLENPLLVEAVAKVQAQIAETWRLTGPRDVDMREQLHIAARQLPKVMDALGEVMTNGEISAATLRGIAGQQPGIVSRLVGR